MFQWQHEWLDFILFYNRVVFHLYSTFPLSIHLSLDVEADSRSWLSGEKFYNKHKRSSLFDRLTLSPLDKCPVVGFLVEAIFYVRVYLKVTFWCASFSFLLLGPWKGFKLICWSQICFTLWVLQYQASQDGKFLQHTCESLHSASYVLGGQQLCSLV